MKFGHGLALAAIAAATMALAPAAHAHHSFASEFDASLTGEVKGEVTGVWWQNPHVRYDVAMKLPNGKTEMWALLPPGNLPAYRTAELERADRDGRHAGIGQG